MTNQTKPLLLPTREAITKMEPFVGLSPRNVHLVTTQHEADSALDDLLHQKAIGFDTESKPTFRKGQLSEGPHVLQFAVQYRAYVFQSHTPVCRPAIDKILESSSLLKVGFGLNDDLKRITDKFKILPRAVIDIGLAFNGPGQKNSIGTKTAIALLFNKRLIKSHSATTSNWASRALSEKQLLYAANDAFAAISVYAELKKRGMAIANKNKIGGEGN
jgi:ribonuclease D